VHYDVIVCGGGTAGAAAGIKAARLGAKTLIVEAMSALGGTQTMGWVTPMMPNYIGGEQISRGLNLEIQGEHGRLSPATDFPNAQVWYNPNALGLALDRMASEAGAECLFYAMAVEAQVSSGVVSEITVACRGPKPLLRFTGDVFIDATGDATLCRLAGAQIESGDATGTNQPMTLRFTLGNVDLAAVAAFFGEDARPNEPDFLSVGYAKAEESRIGDLVRKAVEEGVLAADDLGYFQFFTVLGRPRELAFNCPRLVGFDPEDPFEVSRALAVGREKVFRIAAFCRAYLPGFEASYVSVVAPLMGIRESGRVVGDYVLTEDDHQQCRKFPDAVARNRYPIDIHLADGGVELRKLPTEDYHEIPYRCLLPVGLENVLVAGRCLSATFVAQSSVRIQPVCRALGEAAGAAAALAVRGGRSPRDVEYSILRAELEL
jgi:hypothetical protein